MRASVLALALLLSGCSVASTVKDAATRARESADALREGWRAVEPHVSHATTKEDVAALNLIRATLEARFAAHAEMLRALEDVSAK